MANMRGVVQSIRNSKGMYSFKVNDNWFGAGKYAPKFAEGDDISFDFEENGQWKNMTYGTVVVIEKKPTATTSGSTGGTNWDAKDERITYLACRKDALELVNILVSSGSLALPAKKGEGADIIIAAVNDFTNDYFRQVYNKDWETK